MYAIIETGGKQYRVSEGDIIKVEKLPFDRKDEEIILDKVLMVNKEGIITYGSPYISGAKVKVSIENTTKDKKILIFKQKTRKGYRRLRGHRQFYTTLKIKEIVFGG